jgi:alpha-L-fucosidase
MPIQSRVYTVADLLAEVQSDNLEDGVANCPLRTWLSANQDKTIDEYEAWLQANQISGPGICKAIFEYAYRHNTPVAGAEIEQLYAGFLAGYPFALTRGIIEGLLREPPGGRSIDPEAKRILIDAIRQNHPNAEKFLAQDAVRQHLPSDFIA